MNWRIAELAHYADAIRWLDAVKAGEAYEFMLQFDSQTQFGLHQVSVHGIERLKFCDDVEAGTKWLCGRLPAGQSLVVVFGKTACFTCDVAFFVDNWQDIFCPGRDDAMVYSEDSSLILFVNHEGEFEVGERSL